MKRGINNPDSLGREYRKAEEILSGRMPVVSCRDTMGMSTSFHILKGPLEESDFQHSKRHGLILPKQRIIGSYKLQKLPPLGVDWIFPTDKPESFGSFYAGARIVDANDFCSKVTESEYASKWIRGLVGLQIPPSLHNEAMASLMYATDTAVRNVLSLYVEHKDAFPRSYPEMIKGIERLRPEDKRIGELAAQHSWQASRASSSLAAIVLMKDASNNPFSKHVAARIPSLYLWKNGDYYPR